ncbi:MAG TPA: IS66 family transposase [Polyangiaceae bacterium]|nr:IS66 family transposase [Polyangiaceae bacterium]
MTLDLSKEKDPEVLRNAALLLERENQRLVSEVVKLTKQITELMGGSGEDVQLRLQLLEVQLARAQKQLFGPSSERTRDDGSESSASDDQSPNDEAQADPKPQRGHGRREQSKLPRITKRHELVDADCACKVCGGRLEKFGDQADRSTEIHVIRRVFVNVEHVQQKYRCPNNCGIETAPGPRKLFPRARYSIDFAIEVAVQKYLYHMPLARQVRQMRAEGLEVDTQTLWDQIEKLATLVHPAYERIRQFVLEHAVVGADETTWRMMGKSDVEEGKTWQVWTLAAPTAVYYKIESSRAHTVVLELFKGFRGIVLCDGYKGYTAAAKKLPGLRIANCWAHVRREFKEVEKFFPAQTATVLSHINELFEIERLAIGDSPEARQARLALRTERSKPIVEAIGKWAVEVTTMPGNALAKAIDYMTGVWSGLTLFLENPSVPLSNNITERANRDPVVGRKNHYGSRSKRGTEVAAQLYTLIETAKMSGVDAHAYLSLAVHAALDGRALPLPHEVAVEAAALIEQHFGAARASPI